MVKILGAGISGLTAAINLAKEGYHVEVYEKNADVGMQLKENAQMLPNWLSRDTNILADLKKCNIAAKTESAIKTANVFLTSDKVLSIKSAATPFGYTVLRGGHDSFESSLKKQAEKLGVVINTGFKKKTNANIIATGHYRAVAVAYVRVYSGNFNPSEVYVFLDQKHCPGGYGYIYPHSKKKASLVVSKVAADSGNLKESADSLIKGYKSLMDSLRMSYLYDFGTYATFNIPETAVRNGVIYVGEAAGFQDPLFGFGMAYAVKSGYFAAHSIIEGRDYDDLWKHELLPEMHGLLAIRKLLYRGRKTEKIGKLAGLLPLKLKVEMINPIIRSGGIRLLISAYSKLPGFLQKILLSGVKAKDLD
jgi:flavin-dependent dehydrogenase